MANREPIKTMEKEKMELRDLLSTIKHRLNLASVYGMKAQQVELLKDAIDRFGLGEGRVLDDSELLPPPPAPVVAEEPIDVLAVLGEEVEVDVALDSQPELATTTQQLSALDELVAEAEKMGFYNVPIVAADAIVDVPPAVAVDELAAEAPVEPVAEVEQIQESSDTAVADEPAAEAAPEVTPDNQSEAQG